MEELAKEPFRLTLPEAVWLMKAASTDETRKVLLYANVRTLGGSVWLTTTDTYRLHMVNIGVSDLNLDYLIDLRRMIHEAKFVKAESILIERDGSNATLAKTGKKSERIWPIHSPWRMEDLGAYPCIERVIPMGKMVAPGELNVNPKYFFDAIYPGAHGVRMQTEGPGRTIVITDRRHSYSRWKALVMPMAPGDKE